MVSVAMCTYNGERYLTEQLESIARQNHPVDELVVFDDGSSDRTLQLLDDFAAKSSFEVRVHINKVNLGSTKNFEACLRACKGDILILCDQDDVWKVDKVQRQVDFFTANPSMDAAFSDADLIDDYGNSLGRRLWENFGFDRERQALWRAGKANEILFNGYVVTGATLAIRKTALGYLAPFPTDLGPYIHDAWMAIVLAVRNQIGFIEEPLISYRVHAAQQVGFGQHPDLITLRERFRRDRQEKIKPIQEKATLLGKLVSELEKTEGVSAESLVKLKELKAHFEARAGLPANRLSRFAPALSELFKGRYRMSSKDWWLPFLGDLLE